MTFIVVAFHQVQTMCRKNRQFELQKTFQGEKDVSIVEYSVQVQLKKGDFHKNLNEMLIKFDEKSPNNAYFSRFSFINIFPLSIASH